MTRYLITGCSGGGKSTLLAALGAQGYATVPEPGRRILAEERAGDGRALPWVDELAFAHRAAAMARADLARVANLPGPIFFDRGLLDAAVALAHVTGTPLADTLAGPWPYASTVFLAPPWPEIFVTDADRRHGMAAAGAEYARLEAALAELQLTSILLPRADVAARVAFVRARVAG